MPIRHVQAEQAPREDEEAPFDIADLYPRDTGLPMTVWVSPRGRARHDARVKICRSHGDRMDPTNTAVVAVRPRPRLVGGDLTADDLRAVAAWIEANGDALLRYWDGRLSTVEFVQQMKRI
jgi:hypothetical protein